MKEADKPVIFVGKCGEVQVEATPGGQQVLLTVGGKTVHLSVMNARATVLKLRGALEVATSRP